MMIIIIITMRILMMAMMITILMMSPQVVCCAGIHRNNILFNTSRCSIDQKKSLAKKQHFLEKFEKNSKKKAWV